MNTATFTYDLDTEDGQMAAARALKSQDMANVLFEIAHNIRKKVINELDTEEFANGVEAVLKAINDEIDDNGIIISDLTR